MEVRVERGPPAVVGLHRTLLRWANSPPMAACSVLLLLLSASPTVVKTSWHRHTSRLTTVTLDLVMPSVSSP